ncbi:MAG: hypothetical protein ACE14V_10145 [bacterium]
MTPVSVTQLIEPAFRFTSKLLFSKPFNWKRWVKFALVAWLAGEAFVGGGGSGHINVPFPGQEQSHGTSISPWFSNTWQYLIDHIVVIIVIIAVSIAFVITLCLIFAVLRAIFVFIFLDLLSKKEATVRAGFSQYQSRGWRLFFFRFIVGLIALFIILLFIGLVLLLAFSVFNGFRGVDHGSWASVFMLILGILIFLVIFICIMVVFGLFDAFTTNFVVPTMYLLDIGVIPAWKRYYQTLRTHVWDTVRFVLMKFVLGMAGGIISFVVVLVTLIPFGLIGLVIGLTSYLVMAALHLALAKTALIIVAVAIPIILLILPFSFILICLLLPLAVFFRIYTLMFLSACDPELTVLHDTVEEPRNLEGYWHPMEIPST